MEDISEKDKKRVHRSPAYPVLPLGEAIQKTKAVYDNERRSLTTADVIASHAGYKQATGIGGRVVSALRQFGLIEEIGGKYRISELGYGLVHFDRATPDWRKSAREAALKPTLIKELAEHYSGELPSDGTLKHDLLKRGFNPAAVPEAIQVVRETLSLAGTETGGDEEPANLASASSATSEQMALSAVGRGVSRAMATLTTTTLRVYPFDISIPRNVKGELRIEGDFNKDDLSRLKKALDAQIAMMSLALED